MIGFYAGYGKKDSIVTNHHFQILSEKNPSMEEKFENGYRGFKKAT